MIAASDQTEPKYDDLDTIGHALGLERKLMMRNR
jgi:hypothetical protein